MIAEKRLRFNVPTKHLGRRSRVYRFKWLLKNVETHTQHIAQIAESTLLKEKWQYKKISKLQNRDEVDVFVAQSCKNAYACDLSLLIRLVISNTGGWTDWQRMNMSSSSGGRRWAPSGIGLKTEITSIVLFLCWYTLYDGMSVKSESKMTDQLSYSERKKFIKLLINKQTIAYSILIWNNTRISVVIS